MKFSIVFISVIAASVHGDKFDNVDIDAILKNERLLTNHFNCLLEDKGCTPEIEELKKRLPAALESCCANCSDKQKAEAKKVTQFLIERKPEMAKKVLDKYDPDRKYREKCTDQLKESGIDLSSL